MIYDPPPQGQVWGSPRVEGAGGDHGGGSGGVASRWTAEGRRTEPCAPCALSFSPSAFELNPAVTAAWGPEKRTPRELSICLIGGERPGAFVADAAHDAAVVRPLRVVHRLPLREAQRVAIVLRGPRDAV